MNLSTVALVMLAFLLLNKQNSTKTPDLSCFLSDDTKNIMDCFSKLSSHNCTNDDKLGAILQMISNPMLMSVLQNFMGQNNQQQNSCEKEESFTNDEGYSFKTPSAECKDFFKPIDKIADPEVKSKLYWFYDNWYIK